MTKQALQQEILAKVKPGTKPSHLKRSKSASDIPKAPSLPNSPPLPLLQDQLKEKQREIEQLRAQLEEKTTQLSQAQKELDNSLAARHQNLKSFGQEHQKRQAAQSELEQTINESAEELINQDQTLSNLRSENTQLKQTNQSLHRDLNLASKLAQMRKVPYYPDDFPSSLTYFKYGVYALLAVWLVLLLRRKNV
jgi:DNA repair ATPase RecN